MDSLNGLVWSVIVAFVACLWFLDAGIAAIIAVVPTTVTDVIGFLSFLGLATMFLL